MRAVVFEDAGSRAGGRRAGPGRAGAGRRGRARHASRDLRLGSALLPPEGAGRAGRRPRPRGRGRRGGRRARRHAVRARRPRGGGVRHRVRRLLVLPPWRDPALRGLPRSWAPARSAADLAGAQAERVRVPCADVNLLRDPRRRRRRARAVRRATSSPPVSTPRRSPRSSPDDVVAVVGLGPVGFFCVAGGCARSVRGRCSRSTATPTRLALAERRRVPSPIDVARAQPATRARRGDRRARGRRRARGGRAPRRVRVGAWTIVRRGGRVVVVGHVRRRDGRAAAGRLLGPRDRRAVRGHLSRARLVGTSDGRWWPTARSTRCRSISHRLSLRTRRAGLRVVRPA